MAGGDPIGPQEITDSRVPPAEVVVESRQPAAADPDHEALIRVAAGEVDAFAVVVERHQARLLRLCERMLGDAEGARDAVQEVFLKAYSKAGGYRPQGQVFTWLYRIAVNHCLNRLRRRKVVRFLRLGAGEDDDAAAADFPDPGVLPDSELATRRRWQATRRAIAALPASQRAVVVLAKFEGLPYRRIAELLDTTEGAVESRLFRALRRLEAVVGEPQGSGAPGVPTEGDVR